MLPNLPLARRNLAPIALLGGFTVWGREEALGFLYWGGLRGDIQEELKAQGFETVTVAVGPLASNWDRACEAYAILKGGPVDYGQAHSERHGHARFGRTHPGLLPNWGVAGRKVHLVAHSQGGQTARLLVQLLAEGDADERAATPAGAVSPLFQGGRDWVLSVTTLATPHNGTSLALRHQGLVGPAQKFLALLAGLGKPGQRSIYDFKLDHWGLARASGDSFPRHAERIFASPLWQGTQDFSAWDLSPEGARELNAWVKAQPRTYYFAWSTAKTREDGHGRHVPSPRMTPLWLQGSRFMGQVTRRETGKVLVDETWFRNDGVVNTCSMAGPASENILPFQGTPVRGAWNHMGILEGWDHSEILGIGPEHGGEVLDFHGRWATFLGSLES
jgi:triacylglycerol lipase